MIQFRGGKIAKGAGAALAAAAILAVGAATPAAAAAAPERVGTSAAVNCTSPAHNANGEGAGYMLITANLKTAPYAACGNVRSLSAGTFVYFHCYYYNSYGNLWWWVRVAATETYGWMSDDNLRRVATDDNGNGIYNEFRRC